MHDSGLPQRQQFPRFGAGVERDCGRKAFWRGCDEGEHGDRLTQRQCFPRFGAGTVVQKAPGHDGRKGMFWEVRPQLSFLVIKSVKILLNQKMLVLLLVPERKKESQTSLQLLGFEGGPGWA